LCSTGGVAQAATVVTGSVAADFGLVFHLDQTRATKITLDIDASHLESSWLDRLATASFAVAYDFDANGRPHDIYEEELGTEFGGGWSLDPQRTKFVYVFNDRSGRGCNPLHAPYDICRYFDRDRIVFEGITKGGEPVAFSYSISAVPEPATWALMVAGFGLAGAGLRRSRRGMPQPA
jgi:hypothetical protein